MPYMRANSAKQRYRAEFNILAESMDSEAKDVENLRNHTGLRDAFRRSVFVNLQDIQTLTPLYNGIIP